MKDLKQYLITAGAAFLLGFFIRPSEIEEIEIPIYREIPIPQIIGNFETIAPKPLPPINNIIEVNNYLVEKYKKANDSLKSEMYKKAVTINRYNEKFEDTFQTIWVRAKTTGTLDSLGVSYETKADTIVIDTTIKAQVPVKKRSITPYVEIGVPTLLNDNLVNKAGLDYKTKKNWTIGGSYDTDSRVWVKIGKTFNF